jgi:hypothetical protein
MIPHDGWIWEIWNCAPYLAQHFMSVGGRVSQDTKLVRRNSLSRAHRLTYQHFTELIQSCNYLYKIWCWEKRFILGVSGSLGPGQRANRILALSLHPRTRTVNYLYSRAAWADTERTASRTSSRVNLLNWHQFSHWINCCLLLMYLEAWGDEHLRQKDDRILRLTLSYMLKTQTTLWTYFTPTM